jgi:hypothetical protein
MQKLGSAADLAERYSVNVCTVWRWAADKILEPIKISPGCTRFDIEASDQRIVRRGLRPKDVTAAVVASLQSSERHRRGRKRRTAA